jgi:hypothetical protein
MREFATFEGSHLAASIDRAPAHAIGESQVPRADSTGHSPKKLPRSVSAAGVIQCAEIERQPPV